MGRSRPRTARASSRSTQAREAKDHLVATLKGVTTRNEAERLNGLELYVAREKLPATEDDEYYHADLIGLAAVTAAANRSAASSPSIISAPATSSRSRRQAARPLLLPFTNAVVPTVDIAGGRVLIELPDEIEGDDPTAESDGLSASRPREGGDP